jgi:hypothetical protein
MYKGYTRPRHHAQIPTKERAAIARDHELKFRSRILVRSVQQTKFLAPPLNPRIKCGRASESLTSSPHGSDILRLAMPTLSQYVSSHSGKRTEQLVDGPSGVKDSLSCANSVHSIALSFIGPLGTLILSQYRFLEIYNWSVDVTRHGSLPPLEAPDSHCKECSRSESE